MVLNKAIIALFALNIYLGTALECKYGGCTNNKQVSGCQTEFKSNYCGSDCCVCFNKQTKFYGVDSRGFYTVEQEEWIRSGCINKNHSSTDPRVLPGFNWKLVGPILNASLTADDTYYDSNKACVKRELIGEKVLVNNGRMARKVVEACMCDTDLCNIIPGTESDNESATKVPKGAMNLVFIGMISRFFR